MAAKRTGEAKRKVGRPRKPTEEARRNRLTITLTDDELDRLHQRSKREEKPLGTVVADIVRRVLRREK